MIEIVAFEPWHLARLRGRPQEVEAIKVLGGIGAATMACWLARYAFSAIAPEQQVLACAGVSEDDEGPALAWAFISRDADEHWVDLHRAVKTFLAGVADLEIIDALACCDCAAAHRWLMGLGFLPVAMQQWAGKRHLRYRWRRPWQRR